VKETGEEETGKEGVTREGKWTGEDRGRGGSGAGRGGNLAPRSFLEVGAYVLSTAF